MQRKTRKVILRASIGTAIEVDREAGVIRNVAVITAGTTLPSADGSGPFDVDATALQQVADSINASEIGVKSRMTHPEVEGVDDLPCRLGYIRNARIDNGSVRADMHFHNPASNEAITLMSIAETDPASCGLSIVDMDATLEPLTSATTGMVLRVEHLDAVDWVGTPAANPAGMLSARITLTKGSNMLTQPQLDYLIGIGLDPEANAEAIIAFVEGLDEEQKAALEALATVEAPATEEPATMNADEEEDKPAVAASADEVEEEDKKSVAASAKAGKVNAVALARRVERSRIQEIHTIALQCDLGDKWAKGHIDKETPINEVRRVALASMKRGPDDMATTQVKVGADHNRDTLNQAVQDAIMLRAGARQFVKFDDHGVCLGVNRRPETRKAHDRANEFRGHSLLEMGRRYLVALGHHEADRMNKTQLATLLMSRMKLQGALSGVYLAQATGDFPFLLADSMGKVLRAEYALAPHTWNMWARSTTAPDYKDIKKLQLSEAADLVEIPEGDEYTYASLTENREVYRLAKYGNGLKFTREMLINDDLSAFDRVPRLMGRAAARKVETLAIAVLTGNSNMADSSALFSTAHANLSTGVLTVASLGAAQSLMRRQTALGSTDPLELTPRILLVPETISTTARQLVSSTVDPSKNNATPNPYANQLEVISSARLDANSTAQWYLFADPSEIDTVEIAFLEGEETPVVEEEDEFDSDVRKVKVRHNIAAKAIDWKGMVRSSGA